MSQDNPFNDLNNQPDRPATAIVAAVCWVALGIFLFWLIRSPFNWIAAAASVVYGLRIWLRFRRRTR